MRVGLAEVPGQNIQAMDVGTKDKQGEEMQTSGLLVKVYDTGTHPISVSVRGQSIAISLDEAAEIMLQVLKHPEGIKIIGRNEALWELVYV